MSKKMQEKPALICSEIGLVRCLGAAGIPSLTGTENDGNGAFYSRYSRKRIQFSSYESEDFIRELCDLGKKLDYKPVLMSYDDRLLLNISRNRKELLKYYRFLLPQGDLIENLLDKVKFIDLADEFNLPVPASVKVSAAEDLERVGEQLDKPYLIKPLYRHHWFHKDFTRTVGSYKKAYVCHSINELEEYYNRISRINPDVVVQEYIEGPDDNMYDVNMYVTSSGQVKGIMVCRKMRVYPPVAGYGSYVVTVEDKEIRTLSEQIVAKLKLCGLVNVQFKRNAVSQEPKLIEVHTRTSIFDILGIKAGMNIPALYYADMSGKKSAELGEGKFGIKYIHLSRDLRSVIKNRDKQGLMLSLAKSYTGPKIIDGFSIRDPIPAVMNLWWMIRQCIGYPNSRRKKN